MTRRLLLLAAASIMAASVVAAQAPDDEDAAFDDALKSYGYSGGLAWQCAEEADRKAHIDNVMLVFNRLSQLFGTDRAFFFSASFGAGTVDAFDRATCARHVADFAQGLNPGSPAGSGQ